MTGLKNRVERLEKEQSFQQWLQFERFLEGLSDKQLEDLAIYCRFPEPLPEPLPLGESRLDGLDHKSLHELFEESVYQNFDKPRKDSDGVRWNVRVWHDVVKGKHVARVFFWDDKRVVCGVRIFGPDDWNRVTVLHAFIEKLISSADLRQKYRRDLRFPLERHYSEYGLFPEER